MVGATRGCSTHIEGRLPPFDAQRDLSVGPVRFYAFRQTSRFAAREASGYFRHVGDQYGAVKFVTEAKAGTDAVVAVSPESRDEARLLYDLDVRYGRNGIPFDQGQVAVRFRGCPADHRAFAPRFYHRETIGPWTQYNGGIMFKHAQCLKLDVYVRGRPPRRYAEPFGRATC